MNKRLCMDPLRECIQRMDLNKNQIVIGPSGAGKTTLLEEIEERWNYSDNILINISLNEDELINNSLYEVTLVVKKILLEVNNNFESNEEFTKFYTYINYLEDTIKNVKVRNQDLLNKPFVLIYILDKLIKDNLQDKTITLMIDDIDTISISLCEELKKHFSFIVSIKEESINKEKIDLLKGNKIIKIDYNTNLEAVKSILAEESKALLKEKDKYDFRYRITFILTDDTFNKMIKLSKGNLSIMLDVIKDFYNHIDELEELEYETFILNRINELNNQRTRKK